MEDNNLQLLKESGISKNSIVALAQALSKIESYAPTNYVNDDSPDLDADNLNHAEQGIKRVTDALNLAIDAITALNSDFPYKVIEKYISDTVLQPKQSTEIINDLSSYGAHCSAFLCNIYGGPTIFQLNDGSINQYSFSIINQADVQVTIGGTILYFIV